MKTQRIYKLLLSAWLCLSLTGCPSGGSSASSTTSPVTGGPGGGSGSGGSGGGSGGSGGGAPADPSLSVQVQASSQTSVTDYSVISLSLQEMLVYTGSGFAWEDSSGNQTALTLSGFDFAHFQNIGLSAAGDLVYGIACSGVTCTVSRYGTDGTADATFTPISFAYNLDMPPPFIIGEDATYIYFNLTEAITDGSSINISRYAKASGAIDSAFGTSGVVSVQDTTTAQGGPATQLYLDTPKMTVANGDLYIQATSQFGRYIFILNQTDGSVVTPNSAAYLASPVGNYFGGYEAWQAIGNNAAGFFRNSLEDTQTSYVDAGVYHRNNSGNLIVNQDGSLLSFEGPLMIATNTDYSINTTYGDGNENGASPYGLNFDILANTTQVRVIDAFQLPSGHDLVVYGVNTNGTTQQICGLIVDSTGTPITLTAPGTQPVCQSASWGFDYNTDPIPVLGMVPNSDGSTHASVSNSDGSNTYTYLLNGSTLQAVSFTIME